MRRIFPALLAVIGAALLASAQSPQKIRVLILTGINNHDWRATTPALREILERTGRFQVFCQRRGARQRS